MHNGSFPEAPCRSRKHHGQDARYQAGHSDSIFCQQKTNARQQEYTCGKHVCVRDRNRAESMTHHTFSKQGYWLLWRQSFFAEGTNSSRCMCVKSYCNHGQDGEIIKMQDCLQQTHGGQIHGAHGGSDERRSYVPRSPRPQLSTKRPLNNSPAKKWSQRQ